MENLYDVSVIIPIYNTGKYLHHCFNSVIKALGDLPYEVLLMDDGSTDDSGDIAKAYADSHDGFYYHRLEHGGQGRARNTGIDLARGKYIFFMDSDDFLVPKIIEDMFFSVEHNNAEFAMCNTLIHENNRYTFNTNQTRCFAKAAIGDQVTSLDKFPYLVYCTVITNKLILKDFWIKQGIRFPEGVVMEDTLPNIMLCHKAKNITLLRTRGYIYRIRTDLSNTIRTLTYDYVRQKIDAVESVFDYMDKTDFPKDARRVLEHKLLCSDFVYYTSNLSDFADDIDRVVADIGALIEKNVSKETINHLPLVYRQLVNDFISRDTDRLLRLVEFKNSEYNSLSIEKQNGIYRFSAYPKDLILVDDYELSDDFFYSVPISHIRNITMAGLSLIISGHLYHPRIELSSVKDMTIEAFLVNERTGICHPLHLERVKSDYLTRAKYSDKNAVNYCYDEAGFRIEIDLEDPKILEIMRHKNLIILKYKTPVSDGCRVLRGFSRAASKFTQDWNYIVDDKSITLAEEVDATLSIYINDIAIDSSAEKIISTLKQEKNQLLEENVLLADTNNKAIQKYQESLWDISSKKKEIDKLTSRLSEKDELIALLNKNLSRLSELEKENLALSERLRKTKEELVRQKGSLNWRLGDKLTRIPKKLYYLFKND